MTVSRGTSNGNSRGSTEDRRQRRAFLMLVYASDVEGFARCYRCGDLLFNPDDYDLPADANRVVLAGGGWDGTPMYAVALTVDRIVPGCKGGTYRRNNIRPACGDCNSETGGRLAGTGKKTRKKVGSR